MFRRIQLVATGLILWAWILIGSTTQCVPKLIGGALAGVALAAQTPRLSLVELFKHECAAKARNAQSANTITVQGQENWLFFGPELRHVSLKPYWGSNATKVSQARHPEYADPLPAILDFKAQLDKAGLELLFVPVPPKAIIYPDKISRQVSLGKDGVPRLDVCDQQFYEILRHHKIHVLDLVPSFISRRLDSAIPLYCKQDTHWSGRACVLTARLIVAALHSRTLLHATPQTQFYATWKNVPIVGDLEEELGKKLPTKETLPLRFIGIHPRAQNPQPGTKVRDSDTTLANELIISQLPLAPILPDPDSPVILLGDSHALVFHEGGDMHATGAGLADQLAFELGFPVDLIAVKGSGATPARINLMRQIRADPHYLGKKKIVIWCFSAREFTEGLGWQKIQLLK